MSVQEIDTARSIAKEPSYYHAPKKNSNPSVKGRDYPPQTQVPIIDKITEEKDGKVVERLIRYIPGQKSIYADEQDYKTDATLKELPRAQIMLNEGWLTVDYREVLLNQYLAKCNYNGSNPDRNPGNAVLFVKFDRHKNNEDFLHKEFDAVDLLYKIKHMEAGELEALALALEVYNAEEMDNSTLKRSLVLVAKKDPSKFKKGMEDPRMRRKFYIRKALAEKQMEFVKEDNSIRWADGSVAFQAAIGQKAIDNLAEFIMKDANKDLYDQIRKVVDPYVITDVEEKYAEKAEEPPVAPEVEAPADLDSDKDPGPEENEDEVTKELLDKAVEAGVIEVSGQWHSTDKHGQIGQGWRQAVEAIKESEELKGWIEEQLAAKESPQE